MLLRLIPNRYEKGDQTGERSCSIDNQFATLSFYFPLESFAGVQHRRDDLGVKVHLDDHAAILETSLRFLHGKIKFF